MALDTLTEAHTGERAMPKADPQGVRETPPNTDSAARADDPRPDQQGFPIGLIPLVPLLAVPIVANTYFILWMLL